MSTPCICTIATRSPTPSGVAAPLAVPTVTVVDAVPAVSVAVSPGKYVLTTPVNVVEPVSGGDAQRGAAEAT